MARRPNAAPADPAPVDPVDPAVVDPAVAAAAAPPVVDPAPADPTLVVDPPEEPDEFSKMFSQFSRPGGDPADPQAAPVPPVAPPVDPVAPPVAAASVAPPAPTPAPAPPKPAPVAPAPPVDDPVARLADILTQRQQPQTQQGPEPQRAFFSPEEIQTLTSYYQEWPDVARATDMVVRAAVHATRQEVYREIAGYLKPKLDLLDTLAGNFQYDVLERRIPEYTVLQDKVIAWIGEQPSYLKDAFTGVMEHGTADQVEDLYSRYRAATGLETPAPIAPAAGVSAQSPPAATLPPAVIKAAVRLAPVSSKRTAPATGAPQTFEDGFDAAVRELAQTG